MTREGLQDDVIRYWHVARASAGELYEVAQEQVHSGLIALANEAEKQGIDGHLIARTKRVIRETGLQVTVYLVIATASVTVTMFGSELFFDMLNTKMNELGANAAMQSPPPSVQTASLRPTQ